MEWIVVTEEKSNMEKALQVAHILSFTPRRDRGTSIEFVNRASIIVSESFDELIDLLGLTPAYLDSAEPRPSEFKTEPQGGEGDGDGHEVTPIRPEAAVEYTVPPQPPILDQPTNSTPNDPRLDEADAEREAIEAAYTDEEPAPPVEPKKTGKPAKPAK